MASSEALDELRRIQARINAALAAVDNNMKVFHGKGMDDRGITQA